MGALLVTSVLGAVSLGVWWWLGAGVGPEPEAHGRSPARHVVLIVLDTVRADRMSVYGHERPTTPHLEAMAADMLRYEQARVPAPWTIPAHASMLTARWPAEHRAQWGHIHLDERLVTLGEALQAHGFCARGLSSNGFITSKTGFDRGFDELRVMRGSHATRSRRMLRALPGVLEDVRDAGCPMFLFLNFMDAHIPYNHTRYGSAFGLEGDPPIHSETRKWEASAGRWPMTADRQRRHRLAYDAAIRQLDDHVREVVEMLEARSMLDETVLVITSDHGEGLGSHRELGHSVSVWEEQLEVPLLVRLPGGRRGGESFAPKVSLTGLAPSILDWLGLRRPVEMSDRPTLEETADAPVTADYRDYFAEVDRRWNAEMADRYPELAGRVGHRHVVYCGTHKLIVSADGSMQLYDLARDPHEQRDVASRATEVLDRCRDTYDAVLAAGQLTPFDAAPRGEDDGMDLEQLRALGYVE